MTESLRTFDRLRLRAKLTDAEVAERRGIMLALVGSLELVEIDPIVLERAAQPMPTELGRWVRFTSPPPFCGKK